jgi:hypothetical protein
MVEQGDAGMISSMIPNVDSWHLAAQRAHPATSAAGESGHALGAATGNIGRAASNEGDAMVTAACRRIIAADRIEWRKHGDALERASDPTSGASSALRK